MAKWHITAHILILSGSVVKDNLPCAGIGNTTCSKTAEATSDRCASAVFVIIYVSYPLTGLFRDILLSRAMLSVRNTESITPSISISIIVSFPQ